VKAAQLEMNMIAEGYYSVRNIFENNRKYEVALPITEAVFNILYKGARPVDEIHNMTNFLR
jgi:glycerol-3-phosphate dehydrogenase (NAD(P)+)